MSKIKQVKALGFPWETQDPFLFCAHHRDEYPAGNEHMGPVDSMSGRNIGQDFTIKDGYRMYHGSIIPGFPYHPHRGFETITINKEGFVDHSDSLGAAGRFGKGDVQWMTAGSGVQHSEMFPLVKENEPNPLEIFQIWLNLPKAKKFVAPHFKMLWRSAIPKITEVDAEGQRTHIDLIAGKYADQDAPEPTPDSWANDPKHAVRVMTVHMEPHANWTLPQTSAEANRTLYFYRGKGILLEGTQLPLYHLTHLEAAADIQITNGDEDAYLLVLEGVPLNEPVVQYGPFVMNSEAEIRQAFDDYRRTQFGGWPWPEQEQAHPREAARFALHADGTREDPQD